MITSNSDIPYLGIAFADLLDIDIIQNLKEGFGMMGMRFAGKPNKAQMVKAYDEYVKGNPVDVLRCLRSENLELMNSILKQGKGGHVMVKGTQIYNQLQKMNLVVSRENTRARIDPEEKAQLEQVLQSKEFKDAMMRDIQQSDAKSPRVRKVIRNGQQYLLLVTVVSLPLVLR